MSAEDREKFKAQYKEKRKAAKLKASKVAKKEEDVANAEPAAAEAKPKQSEIIILDDVN